MWHVCQGGRLQEKMRTRARSQSISGGSGKSESARVYVCVWVFVCLFQLVGVAFRFETRLTITL